MNKSEFDNTKCVVHENDLKELKEALKSLKLVVCGNGKSDGHNVKIHDLRKDVDGILDKLMSDQEFKRKILIAVYTQAIAFFFSFIGIVITIILTWLSKR